MTSRREPKAPERRSLKLLLPSFRTRYVRIFAALSRHLEGQRLGRMLNIGCGEGDYDPEILRHCERLDAGDINPDDVAYSRRVNPDPRITYQPMDVGRLERSFEPGTFDGALCIDVLEHVGSVPDALGCLARVLKPGGLFVVTVPISRYPVTYDPVNVLLSLLTRDRRRRTLPIGAFAYGHETLVDEDDLAVQLVQHGFDVIEREHLSHHLVGLFEMYWAGLAQWAFKQNSRNATRHEGSGRLLLRPDSAGPPRLGVWLVDRLIALDRTLFGRSRSAIGVLMVARKRP